MVKLYDDVNMKDIAAAIREKNGKADTYKTSEMADAIRAIEGANYDKMIGKTITEISSNLTTVGAYSFYNCTQLVSADFPKAIYVKDYAFSGATALNTINFPLVREIERYAFQSAKFTHADFPAVTYIGASAFSKNTALTSVNLPKVTSLSGSAFESCSALQSAALPKLTTLNNYTFSKCTALESVDLPLVTSIGTYAFQNGYSLKTIILRSGTMCTLAHTNAFTGCYHLLGTSNSTYNPNGLKDCYIYVPSALINSYKADSYWSTYASQFRALESYTVDGTTTGALDESKI